MKHLKLGSISKSKWMRALALIDKIKMPRPDNVKRLSMTLQEKCMQEREKLRVKTMKSLKADMWRLYTHATDADLTVKPREGEFKVHRQIIKQRMPLLLQDLTDDDTVIRLPNVNLEDAKELFRLIYMTDDLSLATEMAAGYLSNTTDGSTAEITPDVNNKDSPLILATPDLVQGLTANTGSTDELRDIQSPTSETPIDTSTSSYPPTSLRDIQSPSSLTPMGSTSSYPPTPVDENFPSFTDVPAYLVGASDVPYLPASGLGLDLLRMFVHSSDGDVVFQVGDEEFRGHRLILTARCNYFDMMLSGPWAESTSQSIKLEGVSSAAFHQALLYLYGGVIDLDTGCHVQDLLVLADMYGIEGLKDVVSYEIKKNYCHFFHKPCQECIAKAADALCLTFSHGMEDLLHRILRWCDKYFVKLWPTKQFALLPTEILEKCCDTVSGDLTKDSVIDVIFDCDKLKGSIPQVKWAAPINKLAERLMDACVVFLQNNLFEVLESRAFSDLGKNMAWSLNFLEEVVTTTVKQMPHAVSCKTFMSAYRLSEHADTDDCGWNDDFKVFVRALTEKCRQNLRNNISYLEFTPEFEQLPPAEQKTIKEASTRYVIKHLPRQPSYLSPGASFVSVSKAKRTPPKLSSDNKKFTGKKHGGIPFNLPKGVPPKAKLKLKTPDKCSGASGGQESKKTLAASSSMPSTARTKPQASTRSKTQASGASGQEPKKTVPKKPIGSGPESTSAAAASKTAAAAASGSGQQTKPAARKPLPKPNSPRAKPVASGVNSRQELKKSAATSQQPASGKTGSKSNSVGATKTNDSGASGGLTQKTSNRLPNPKETPDGKKSGAPKKTLGLPNPNQGAGAKSGLSPNITVRKASPAKARVNQSFDLGVKKLDVSMDQGSSKSKSANTAKKSQASKQPGLATATASTSGIQRKATKPPNKKAEGGASGGRKSISPSSDSGVSSVGSTAEMRPPKRPGRKSLSFEPPKRKPDERLNMTMPGVPIAQSTPLPRPSKLRQPQIHSPTKERSGTALFKVPASAKVKMSTATKQAQQKSLAGAVGSGTRQTQGGESNKKTGTKKPLAISVSADKNEPVKQKSHLPVRSPDRKTLKTARQKVTGISPAKSLPSSPIGGRTNNRLNQSCLPLPTQRPASASGRIHSPRSLSTRQHRVSTPPKPKDYCTICNEMIGGDNAKFQLPESHRFNFQVLPDKVLGVDFITPDVSG